MDLFLGYAGVALTFVIMMTILLLLLIKANNISWKLKAIVIPMVIWWSVALYNIPDNFEGWPADKWQIQNQVIILNVHIVEDTAFYFTVIDYNIENVRRVYDPRTLHMPHVDATPRLYVVKYNSDLHKRLVEARNKLRQQGRGSMMMRMDRLQGLSQFGDQNKPLFELFDPADVLRKADTQQH